MDEEILDGVIEGVAFPIMQRTLGFEKTVQTKQYHPIKFSSYVKEIPLEFWSDSEKVLDLWKILHLETYLMFSIDYDFRNEMGAVENPTEYLDQLRKEIYDRLDLTGLEIEHIVSIDEEYVNDEREEVD